MGTPAPQLLRVPRSLTAPDAWIAVLILAYLQYKQYKRGQQNGNGKIHAGAKSRPKRIAAFSPLHEMFLTNLRMMVSPYASQASDLNAEMVDLQSDQELNSYANKVASGKAPKKKSKSGSGKDGNGGETIEVRSRRLVRGEMVYNSYYPAVETTFNLALSLLVGLSSRWILGLIRSLKLSSASTNTMSASGPGGPCCSPYRGGDNEGTRLPGSFERLLACVLIKQDGDNAGSLFFTMLLLAFFVGIFSLAWSVSSPSAPKDEDLDDDSSADSVGQKQKKNEGDTPTYRRVHPRKVKRFIVGVLSSLMSLMIFHTPALLRVLGLAGLTEAVEELGTRMFLFGNLLGVVSSPTFDSFEDPSEPIQTLMNGLLIFLALLWGYISAGMMTPVEETARNAAHILSPSTNKSKKPMNPNEMMDLINARMMLIIQAMAPFIIMCTYLFNARFAETTKTSARGEHAKMNFSKQYLQNSGLFVRVVLSWCFVGACFYTYRALLQSFLDQASTVASAMATMGEGIMNSDAAGDQRSRNKRTATSTSQTAPPKADPFNDRYQNLVLTAGRIAAFPTFVLAMLAAAHLRGGNGSTHPGVGHKSKPRDAPSSVLPARGLILPYGDRCMAWISNQSKLNRGEASAGDALLHVAAMSQAPWETNPFRDSAQKKLVNWVGRDKFCYPPETRAVRAVGRHVNYLLDNDGRDSDEESILTINALTGRELLDMAPPIPATFVDVVLGRISAGTYSEQKSCKNDDSNTEPSDGGVDNSEGSEECKAPENLQYPSISEMFSFLMSHNFFTPTVVFPIIDTFAFLSSIWWTYWYSVMTFFYWIKLRGAAFLQMAS